MAKKITAPHSYDPGKGRPKEYLAYLNEREMAYLRSINGNNMERGPRGLPSFPPDDAIGSSSKAGSTKSTTSSGAGRDSPRGLGQGAGGSAIGRGPSGGGNLGGGGKSSPGGTSGSSGGLGGGSKGSPGSSPSSPGGLRGAGGNYGPGSGKPGTTSSAGGGFKGPSSPMGGQGTSFSSDTKAQQEAQVRGAISAVKNSPAFRNDAASGGIRAINVGPIKTPVSVGNPISSGMSFTGPQAAGKISKSLTDANKYSSPLTPGMTPEDMARRGAMMNQIEQEIRDMYRDDLSLQKKSMENSFGTLPSGTFQTASDFGDVYSPENEFYQSTRVPSWKQSMPGPTPTPTSSASNEVEGVDATNMSTEEIVEALRPSGKTRSAAEAWENTPYGEPGVQARKKGAVENFLRKVPNPYVRLATKGYGYVEDRRIAGMTPDERIAEMDKRAQMDRSRFKGSDGREDGIGSGGKNEPPRITPVSEQKPESKPKKEGFGPRPAIYYKWDMGVDVPSPTDSDYNLYTKYLQEKAAAKAGFA